MLKFKDNNKMIHIFDNKESLYKYICYNWSIQDFQIHIGKSNIVILTNKLGEEFAAIGEIL